MPHGGAFLLLALSLLATGYQDAAPWQSLARAWDAAWQRGWPRQPRSQPVVIVAIDEASLATYGQWPWPRSLVAELLRRILQAGPAALGVDIVWSEPDRLSPEVWVAARAGLADDLASRLRALPGHDRQLAEAIGGQPVVLAVAGLPTAAAIGPLTPVRTHGSPPGELISYAGLLRSLRPIESAAAGFGLISAPPQADGLVREMPLLAKLEDGRMIPALAMEMLRLAAGASWFEVRWDSRGENLMGVADLFWPIGADGMVRPYLGAHRPERFLSAAELMAGRGQDRLAGRLVLLGVTGLGLVDYPVTLLGKDMPGVELQAQLLENLFDQQLLQRPAWAGWLQRGWLLLSGLLLILLVPRLSPLAALGLWSVTWLLPLAGAGWAFSHRLLLDFSLSILAGGLLFVWLLGWSLQQARLQRRRLGERLRQQQLVAAQLDGELQAARRIQLGLLPPPENPTGDRRFSLRALMEPAKSVGGDFYDYCLLDGQRLFFAVGDVSGKGIPASLFMALSKALTRSALLRDADRPASALSVAADEINRENPEMMFVTLFLGVLHLDTGELHWCNAGHEPPWLLAADGARTRLQGNSGPPLCVLEGFAYQSERRRLAAGDCLLISSDGLLEAKNQSGAFYGDRRLEAVLDGFAANASAASLIEAVRQDLAVFTADAEPFDDLTLLALCWRGQAD